MTTALDIEVTVPAMQRRGISKLPIAAHERLIVALDVDTKEEALELVTTLGDAVDFYKVGLQLWVNSGYYDLIDELNQRGKKIFADLKFYDIPATIGRAMSNLQKFHPTFVTLHAQEIAAIQEACKYRNGTKILGVTVLTSLSQEDLTAQGVHMDIEDLVIARARVALDSGCDGLISSGQELDRLRSEFSDGIVIVVPGIRGDKRDPDDDQKRVIDVEDAFAKGADYIVVGRPIRDANDPRTAAISFQERIAALFPNS